MFFSLLTQQPSHSAIYGTQLMTCPDELNIEINNHVERQHYVHPRFLSFISFPPYNDHGPGYFPSLSPCCCGHYTSNVWRLCVAIHTIYTSVDIGGPEKHCSNSN